MHNIIIIGAGFAGLGLAIQLQKAGFHDFLLIEKSQDVGGVWRDNTYPGAACDVPSHLYSFSFHPNPAWSRSFSPQKDIYCYLKDLTDHYALWDKIQFESEVVQAHFDAQGFWRVKLQSGEVRQSKVLVSALGALNIPSIPEITGLKDFEGTIMHTARWQHDYDFTGKNVAVIGTGASAIQVIPHLQKQAKKLSVFQRTPPWVFPKADRPYKPWEQRLFERLPVFQQLSRWGIFWSREAFYSCYARESLLTQAATRLAKSYLKRQVPDPELRQKLTPNYTLGCKRVLLSNDYYPSVQAPNVEVITTPIQSIESQGIRDQSGHFFAQDCLVMATGFKVPSVGVPFEIQGLPGHTLSEAWAQGSESYKGITVAGYPNFLNIMGPNTGTGHTSVIFYIEAQIRYILQYLNYLEQEQGSYLDLQPEAQTRFNERLQKRMQHTVWTSGCASWYLAPNGKNTTLWPSYSWDYYLQTYHFDAPNYHVTKAPQVHINKVAL